MQDVALVTGASAGIGHATVRRLLALGYTVYAAARRVDRMADLEAEGARVVALDVTDDASLQAGVSTILEQCGRLDLLVNNAGYGCYGSLEDTDLGSGRRQLEVNVIGLARLIQLVVPTMRAARRGRIINVTSIGGKFGEPLGCWYHASKYAVEGLSDSLRLELAEFGIDVVIVEPGLILTEWSSIAVDGLLETSGQTAYGRQAAFRARVINYNPALSSRPEVVARTIGQAARARRPRTRYATGHYARSLMFMRKVLPDRAFYAYMDLCYWMLTNLGPIVFPVPKADDES